MFKDNYFAPEGVEVDNEDFIRRWNGAYDVLTVRINSLGGCPKIGNLLFLKLYIEVINWDPCYSLDLNTM